jgi:lipoprotein signal peptidase
MARNQEPIMPDSCTKATQGLIFFFALAVACLALDLVTKNAIAGTLPDEARLDHAIRRQVVIPQCFSLLYHSPLNKGALFSLGNQFGIQANTFFLCVSCAAVVGILTWALWPRLKRTGFQTFTLAVVLGGALGNLHDRWVYGGVRDWIWVYYERAPGDFPFNWPVFNLADCFLIGGACLLVIHGLFIPEPKKTEPQANPATLSPA